MNRHLLLAAPVALAIACGGPRAPARKAPERILPPPDPAARENLTRQLEATVLDGYVHLNLNNNEAFRSGLSRGHEVTLLGPLVDQTFHGRARRLVAPRFSLGKEGEILSKNLTIELSTSGEVGWVFDEISYRVEHASRIASIPVRRTATYLWENGEWLLVQEHRSIPIAVAELSILAAQGALPSATAVRQRALTSRVAPAEVATALALFQNGVGDARDRIVSGGERALLLLPGWDHEFAGERMRQAPRLAELFGPDARLAAHGCDVDFSPSRRAAWAYCASAVRGFPGAAPHQELGLRATYVLERISFSGWRVLQGHVSAPLPNAEFTRRAFGE